MPGRCMGFRLPVNAGPTSRGLGRLIVIRLPRRPLTVRKPTFGGPACRGRRVAGRMRVLANLRSVFARLACLLVLVLALEPFFNTFLAKAATDIPALLAFLVNAPGRLIAFLMNLCTIAYRRRRLLSPNAGVWRLEADFFRRILASPVRPVLTDARPLLAPPLVTKVFLPTPSDIRCAWRNDFLTVSRLLFRDVRDGFLGPAPGLLDGAISAGLNLRGPTFRGVPGVGFLPTLRPLFLSGPCGCVMTSSSFLPSAT